MTWVNTMLGPHPTANLNPLDQSQSMTLPLRDGVPDSPQILDTMFHLQKQFGQSAFVREFTASILPVSVGNNQSDRAAGAVADFVREHLRYMRDPNGVEYLISPLILINAIKAGQKPFGDCDDHVLLMCSMLESIGIEARPVAVQLFSTDRYDHVIGQAFLDNGWTDFDPCVKNGGRPVYRERLQVA